jgi:hypothetical protein
MGFVKDAWDSITGKSAARKAGKAQERASRNAMAAQKKQFEAMLELNQPYVDAGLGALGGQQDILGLNGQQAQQSAIDNIENSPFFKSQYQQAENAMMQNAAAMGGLRGGNIREALADNRSNMLYNNVQGQLQNLGGLTTLGQNAAAGSGAQSVNFGNNMAQGHQNIGQAQAGYQLAKGQINQGLLGFGLKAGASALGFGGF